jgi:hypothetical protein
VKARSLEVASILATAERLSERVDDRFHERGINKLATELVALARDTQYRIETTHRPHWGLRIAIAVVVAAGVVVLTVSASRVSLGSDISGIDEWLAVVQNGIQDIVFIGIAVAFLVTIEHRLRRRNVLSALHQLRSVAHVIDMHQLTKDPDMSSHPERQTEHSPERDLDRWQLSRYLDYCSEMLSLTSKLAALYAQASTDATVLAAVREIEDLTGTLSNKIWQKIMVLDVLEAD